MRLRQFLIQYCLVFVYGQEEFVVCKKKKIDMESYYSGAQDHQLCLNPLLLGFSLGDLTFAKANTSRSFNSTWDLINQRLEVGL